MLRQFDIKEYENLSLQELEKKLSEIKYDIYATEACLGAAQTILSTKISNHGKPKELKKEKKQRKNKKKDGKSAAKNTDENTEQTAQLEAMSKIKKYQQQLEVFTKLYFELFDLFLRKSEEEKHELKRSLQEQTDIANAAVAANAAPVVAPQPAELFPEGDLPEYDALINYANECSQANSRDQLLIDAAVNVANNFRFHCNGNEKESNRQILIATKNILENNTHENRLVLLPLIDANTSGRRNKTLIGCGSVMAFLGIALLVAGVALSATGFMVALGLPLLLGGTFFMLNSSIMLTSGLAERGRAAALTDFNQTASPFGMFGRTKAGREDEVATMQTQQSHQSAPSAL